MHSKESKLINMHDFASLDRLVFQCKTLVELVKCTLIDAIQVGFLSLCAELVVKNIRKLSN